MDPSIPQCIQRSTFCKQHSQLSDMNSSHKPNINPKESSDAPFNPTDNTEDTKTHRDLDKSKTDDVKGLRGYAPLYRRIGSIRTDAFDVLSQT